MTFGDVSFQCWVLPLDDTPRFGEMERESEVNDTRRLKLIGHV